MLMRQEGHRDCLLETAQVPFLSRLVPDLGISFPIQI